MAVKTYKASDITQLTEHFNVQEFRCKCGSGHDILIDDELVEKLEQYFTVVPDFKAVGVRNHERSMGYMVVIRAVNTIDAMTASIERIDYDILENICARITAEVPSVSRVCYEITPKPVATIEFE